MKLIYVVVVPSAYRPEHLCLLGEGSTKREAIADAYGPGGKLPSFADCYAVDEDTAQAMRESASE